MDRPLAEQLRPKTLNDVCGQHHLLDKGKLLRKAIENNRITNMIFYGPPGTGKTTIANIIADATQMELHKLNGTTATIEDIKKIIEEAKSIFARKDIFSSASALILTPILLAAFLSPSAISSDFNDLNSKTVHLDNKAG